MVIRTPPSIQYPDVEKIRDEILKSFNKDLADALSRVVRSIHDDIVALEKVERVANLASRPAASSIYLGKFIIVDGTGAAADGLFICVDTGSNGFLWKVVTIT